MAVVPTYESKVTLQANNGGGANTPFDVSKMFPAIKPDFSKVGVALMKAQDKMDKAGFLSTRMRCFSTSPTRPTAITDT
jgi:hypothetical protein